MNTPWGDIPVSDAHVHFFSYGFFSALAAQRKSTYDELQPALNWELPLEDPALLADRWVGELDRHGLASAVLMASVPGDEGSVAAAVHRHPERLRGFFMINPTQRSPETHVAAALSNGALQGICLFPAMHHYSLHDTRLMPIYEIAASRPGTAVFVHCGALTVGVRKKLGLVSNFDHAPTARAVLARHGLDRHLAATVISAEFGWRKPHPGIFREALASLDVAPPEALYVGDTHLDDVIGALGVGMDVVWLAPSGGAAPEPTPTFRIANLAELPALLGH